MTLAECYLLDFFTLLSSALILKFFAMNKELDSGIYRYSRAVSYALVAIALFMIVTNWYTGWLFTLDSEGLYHRGTFKLAFYGLNILLYVIVLVNEVKYRSSIRNSIVWFITLGICVFILLFQAISWNFLIICICQFVVLLTIYVNEYLSDRTALVSRKLMVEEEKRKEMLEQIHPEFLLSSLECIEKMDGNPEDVVRIMGMFRRYVDENIQSSGEKDLIPFSDELSHVELYLRLEKYRFKEKLKYEIHAEDTSFEIVPLVLQQIVENAVRNGVTIKEEGGKVTITVKKVRGGHKIIVEDDGVGFNTVILRGKDPVHGGILVVRDVLYNILGGKLIVESEIGKGTTVSIFIPD